MTKRYDGPVYYEPTPATAYLPVASELTDDKDAKYRGSIAWSLAHVAGDENRDYILKHLRHLRSQKRRGGSVLARTALHLARFTRSVKGVNAAMVPKDGISGFCGLKVVNYDFPFRKASGASYVQKRTYTLEDDQLNRVKIILRLFYNDLFPELAPALFKDVKTGEVKPKTLNDSHLIRAADFHRVMQVTQHPCDRAMLAILAETGMRIGALASLNVGDVLPQDDGTIILNIDPSAPGLKTPQAPKRIYWAVPFVKEWLGSRGKAVPQEPLIPNVRRRPGARIRSETVNSWLKTICQKAGVPVIHCHMFRRTVATEMACHGMPRAKMNALFGWSPRTSTADRYVVLSKADLTTALHKFWKLPTNGVERQPIMGHMRCPACGHVISIANSYCPHCATVIDPQDRTPASQVAAKHLANVHRMIERLIPHLDKLVAGTNGAKEGENVG